MIWYLVVQRPEIVEWVNQGGGEVVNYPVINKADFTIECHGVLRSAGSRQTIHVSSHWVRSCLEVLFFSVFNCYLLVISFILEYFVQLLYHHSLKPLCLHQPFNKLYLYLSCSNFYYAHSILIYALLIWLIF